MFAGISSTPAWWDGFSSTEFSRDLDPNHKSTFVSLFPSTGHQAPIKLWFLGYLAEIRNRMSWRRLHLTAVLGRDVHGVLCKMSFIYSSGLGDQMLLGIIKTPQPQGHLQSRVVQQHFPCPLGWCHSATSWQASLEPPRVSEAQGSPKSTLVLSSSGSPSILLQFLFPARHRLPVASASVRGNWFPSSLEP